MRTDRRKLVEEGVVNCCKCDQIKPVEEFYKVAPSRHSVTGYDTLCKECRKQNRRDLYKVNKDYFVNGRLRYEFGIDLEQYKILLVEQGGVCAICGKTPEENGRMLAVDHNHTTNKNRGILCSSCNVCVGIIENNNIDVSSISNYLEKYKD